MTRAGIAPVVVALAIAAVVALGAAGCDRDLVPSPRAQHDARQDADAGRLEAQLAAIPGVARARVVLHRPFVDPLAPPGTRVAAGSAAILLVPDATTAADTLDGSARRLARAALPDLAAAAITVEVVAPARAPVTTAAVGPFEVAAHSQTALRATLALAFAAIAALAAVLAYRERYRRRGIRPHQSSTSTTRGS